MHVLLFINVFFTTNEYWALTVYAVFIDFHKIHP